MKNNTINVVIMEFGYRLKVKGYSQMLDCLSCGTGVFICRVWRPVIFAGHAASRAAWPAWCVSVELSFFLLVL